MKEYRIISFIIFLFISLCMAHVVFALGSIGLESLESSSRMPYKGKRTLQVVCVNLVQKEVKDPCDL